jgi:hypothetical protein
MTVVVRTHKVLVKASLQRAFEYVSDLTRHPEWSDGELKIEEITPGPVAIGKEYHSRGEVAIQKDRPNTVRISHYEPCVHISGKGWQCSRKAHDDLIPESDRGNSVSLDCLPTDRPSLYGESAGKTQGKT